MWIEWGSMGTKKCKWFAEGFISGGKQIVGRVKHQYYFFARE